MNRCKENFGRRIRDNCRHFLGDRPCLFHKAEGVRCSTCAHYEEVKKRILIIKLGAMGDVLRTTSILPTLAKHFKEPHITWITQKESVDLLKNNPYLDSILPADANTVARLQTEAFDLVINPETTKESEALASLARGRKKKGFGLSGRGVVYPFNPEARQIFLMGLFDDLKKKNRKTYEQLICRLSDLSYERRVPMLFLGEEEVKFGEKVLLEKGFTKENPVVGINTGGGTRWPLKRWTTDGFIQLGKRLTNRLGAQVLLFGGPTEVEINRKISFELGKRAIDTGCSNSPRQFAVLLRFCDVLVTGDSLALHLGLALQRRMVVLLGPTSEAEIDLYGLGEKITAQMDCLCCYRQSCSRSPNCMENISVETVCRSVRDQFRFLH